MTILSRLLFFVALFGLTSAAVLWDSMTGVILWRVSLALAVVALGINFLWVRSDVQGLSEESVRKNSTQSVQTAIFVLSIVQLCLVLFTFVSFYLDIGSGLQFIFVVAVAGSGFLLISLIWLALGRSFHVYLMDQLIPYMAVVIFSLSTSLSSDAVLYAQIFGAALGLLCIFRVYKNGVRLKYIMETKG